MWRAASLTLGLTLAASGARAQSIQSDYDRAYDFSKLKTYAYMEQTRGPNDPLRVNTLNDRRVRAALDSQLVAHGYTQATGATPDFLIAYHASTRNRLNINDWGYGPGRWGTRRIDVNESTEGTLIVDFIDASNRELVWRGTATGTIQPKDADKKIKNAVKKLVDRYAKDARSKS